MGTETELFYFGSSAEISTVLRRLQELARRHIGLAIKSSGGRGYFDSPNGCVHLIVTAEQKEPLMAFTVQALKLVGMGEFCQECDKRKKWNRFWGPRENVVIAGAEVLETLPSQR